jgi:3-hydroxyacyl-CoA dehydrogenase/enoyl-CoA hydratase/3-hydroxybutyryl-CoA epimerase
MLMVAPAMLKEKTRGCYPAPEAILSAMVEGSQVSFETALRIESRYFVELATGQIAKNMIGTLWFQMNEIKGGKSRPADYRPSKVKKVGVLGAGMMGSGIAYACAIRGIPVVLKDAQLEAAEKGKSYTEKLLDKKVSRGQMSLEKKAEILKLIQPTIRPGDFENCDLVIEAVFENRDLKSQVIREVEPYLASGAVISSNTSTLPITGLASAAKQQESFIGLHFFSPVDKMDLVEIIRGNKTSDETLARAFDFVLQIHKTPIVVNDSRGFFTSRVFRTFIFEGMAMLAEGQFPSAIEMGAITIGMPVGPLAVTDEVSLSLCANIMAQTKADFESEGRTYVSHPAETVIRQMTQEFKRSGKAAGAGFYEYPKCGKKYLWPDLQKNFAASGKGQIPFQDIQDRLIFIQAIETLRCMEEKVLTSERDANIGSIFGIGFPAWSGGAIQFVRQYGTKRFIARATELSQKYGERFLPPYSTSKLIE